MILITHSVMSHIPITAIHITFLSQNGVIFKFPSYRKKTCYTTMKLQRKHNFISCPWLFLWCVFFSLPVLCLPLLTKNKTKQNKTKPTFNFINILKFLKKKKNRLFFSNHYQLSPIFLIFSPTLFPYQAKNWEEGSRAQKPRQIPRGHAETTSWKLWTMEFRAAFTF